MKIRNDFVTNSSSSSFILNNKTDHDMTAEEFFLELMKPVIEDAKQRGFTVPANGSYTIECGDHRDDGALENFIHFSFNTWGGMGSYVLHFTDWIGNPNPDITATVEFEESHH